MHSLFPSETSSGADQLRIQQSRTHQISKKTPHSAQTIVVSSTQSLHTQVETRAKSVQSVVDTQAHALQTVVESQVQTRQTVVVTQTQIRQIHEYHELHESHAFLCSCSHRSNVYVHVVTQTLHRCDQVVSQSLHRCCQTCSQLRQARVCSVRQEMQRTVRHFTGCSSRQHPDHQPDKRPEPHEHGQSSEDSGGTRVVRVRRVALVLGRSNVLGTFILHGRSFRCCCGYLAPALHCQAGQPELGRPSLLLEAE